MNDRRQATTTVADLGARMSRARRIKVPVNIFRPILLLGLAVTVAVSGMLIWMDIKRAQQRFMIQAAVIEEGIGSRFSDDRATLAGFAAFFQAMGALDQVRFSSYSNTVVETRPHIKQAAYIHRVEAGKRAAFESQMQSDGYLDFSVTEWRDNAGGLRPPQERPVYYPVLALAPAGRHSAPLHGYDMHSDPILSRALMQAIRTGVPAASLPVQFPFTGNAYVLFKAIYEDDPFSDTRVKWQRDATRIVAMIIDPQQMYQSIAERAPDVGLVVEVLDVESANRHVLFHSPHRPSPDQGISLRTFRHSFYKVYMDLPIYVSVQQALYLDSLSWYPPALAVGACLFITFLLLYIVNARYSHAMSRRQDSETIHRERERAQVTLQSIADAVISTDISGKVEYINPAAERLTGWLAAQARGRHVDDVLAVSGTDRAQFLPSIVGQGRTVKPNGELVLCNRDGKRYFIDLAVSPLRDSASGIIGAVFAFQDVGETRRLTSMLIHQATHDELTGLINRREFDRQLKSLINEEAKDANRHVLLYLDLDQFKVVNDTCGHVAGDRLLQQVAGIMKPCIGRRDVFARLGGDEFALLLKERGLDEALRVAEQLLAQVKTYRFRWDGKTFEVGVSIGAVPLSPGRYTLTQVMRFADSACYVAKEKGRNRVHVFQEDDAALLKREGEMQWVHRITQAYSENRFVLFAQRILPVKDTGETDLHFEILLRMRDDDGAMILPAEYISAAEQYNMMADLDRWVMFNAFPLIQRYVDRRAASPDLPVRRFAINLSGESLSTIETLNFVKEQLAKYPALSQTLIFEITETAAISNLEQAEEFVAHLKGLGVRFALDDFGSGVSSFAYLKNLAVDYLKIDGQFIRELDSDPIAYVMVESINKVAQVMGIKTIAEYVDSADVRERLAELNVDYGQGNWLFEPRELTIIVDQ